MVTQLCASGLTTQLLKSGDHRDSPVIKVATSSTKIQQQQNKDSKKRTLLLDPVSCGWKKQCAMLKSNQALTFTSEAGPFCSLCDPLLWIGQWIQHEGWWTCHLSASQLEQCWFYYHLHRYEQTAQLGKKTTHIGNRVWIDNSKIWSTTVLCWCTAEGYGIIVGFIAEMQFTMSGSGEDPKLILYNYRLFPPHLDLYILWSKYTIVCSSIVVQ